MDDYISSRTGFNRTNRIRRAWQRGGDNRGSFSFRSRLFVANTPFRARAAKVPLESLHHWISDALKGQTQQEFLANPDRPKFYNCVDGKPLRLEENNAGIYEPGDIVWMTFKMMYNIGTTYWSPELEPLEFMRVGRLQDSLPTALDGSVFPETNLPELESTMTLRMNQGL